MSEHIYVVCCRTPDLTPRLVQRMVALVEADGELEPPAWPHAPALPRPPAPSRSGWDRVAELDPGPSLVARFRRARDPGHGDPLGQGEHLWGGEHRHLPLPTAAAVSASVTVCRKAAGRPGSKVRPNPTPYRPGSTPRYQRDQKAAWSPPNGEDAMSSPLRESGMRPSGPRHSAELSG